MLTDEPLSIERLQGSSPDVLIFRLTGPLTLRNLFDIQSELRAAAVPPLTLLDLTAVPYMDSAGMGLLMNHYVHCQTRGAKLIVVGASNRLLDVFKITRVDTILPFAATVEEAEARA
ncbi:MAG: STAS domain-containing protein [Terracidiphilus sp.]